MPNTALDNTVGGTSANSYATAAEGDAYATERLNSTAWTGASAADKVTALIAACRRLQQEVWAGTQYTITQALAWPRFGTYNADGIWYDSTSIPAVVKRAQLEIAFAMLAGALVGEDLLADTGLEAFDEVKAGSIDVKPNHARTAGTLSANVQRELSTVMLSGYSGGITLVRG